MPSRGREFKNAIYEQFGRVAKAARPGWGPLSKHGSFMAVRISRGVPRLRACLSQGCGRVPSD